MRYFLRTLTTSLFATMVAAGTLSFADVQARSVSYDLNIPAEDLTAALQSFAIASHHKLLYKAELTAGKTCQALKGRFTAEEAMQLLLSGTGLSYEITGASVVLIKSSPDAKTGDERVKGASTTSAAWSQTGASAPVQMAQVSPSTDSSAPSAVRSVQVENSTSATPGGERAGLNEIIVTAQKKSERLEDVPIPVTAISAETLVDQNQFRLQDYYTSVPGLSLATRFDGSPEITIRGISTGFNTNPTVGVTVDDVPYGSSTNLGGADYLPDFDPSDLARVEVLRGPQGTLYGANSIGGILKYVTVDPSTDTVSGLVQAGTTGVYHGNEPGYSFRGSVNIPLSDAFAVRASGFTRRDPGYIDNVETGQHGVNDLDVYGGRVAALWRPSQDFSLKLSALIQDSRLYGAPFVEVGPGIGISQQSVIFGALEQSELPGAGTAHKRLEAYSATANAKLGSIDLVSVSGYNINRAADVNDFSFALGSPAEGTNNTKNYKFSQELRLSGWIGSRFEWLAGGFYTHEDTPYVEQILSNNPAGAIVATLYNSDYPTTYTEYAGFADLTLHFTDQFDVQFGGRESHIKETYSEIDTGPFVAVSPQINPEVEVRSNSFTYLVTPRFKVSPDLMVYARFASGYRPGGPNQLCTVEVSAPCQFGADKTTNYDLGVKGDVLDHVLSFDASLYYIDWKNIQLELTAPGGIFNYIANAGTAKSEGVELSGEARPLRGLTVAAWAAWNDAVLTEAFPAKSTAAGGAYGADGERLPYSSRYSGDFSVREELSITNHLSGIAGGDVSYVGNRVGEFSSSPLRANYPGYAQINLRTGAKFDAWTVQLFLNNAADKRGLLYGGLGSPNPAAYFFITPRTAGVSVSRAF
jgi:iron complex outermembrane receptor protein